MSSNRLNIKLKMKDRHGYSRYNSELCVETASIVKTRHETIMFQKMSIVLLSSAPPLLEKFLLFH